MHEIEPFKYEEVVFYALVWLAAFIGALARTIRDRAFRNIGHLFATGFTAGLFSFGVVAFLLDNHSGDSLNPWYYIAVSALIGLAGKEQDYYLRMMIQKIFNMGQILFKDLPKEKDDGKGT